MTLADEMRQLGYEQIKQHYKYQEIITLIKDAVNHHNRSIEVWVDNNTINTTSLEEVLIADGLKVKTSGDRISTTFYISW